MFKDAVSPLGVSEIIFHYFSSNNINTGNSISNSTPFTEYLLLLLLDLCESDWALHLISECL